MHLTLIAIIFWSLIFLVFYTYAGYALFAWGWTRLRPTRHPGRRDLSIPDNTAPSVAFIIAAYDEEAVIERKIANTLALEYPRDRLRIIVVTDGSTDRTAALVSMFGKVEHLHDPFRKGKAAALNRAVAQAAGTDILVFSDANALLNREALLLMAAHFSDPGVGGVSGEKKVRLHPGSALQGESLYWQYESALKRIDSDFHTVVSAAGELFSVRTELCPVLPEDTILDDLYITLSICMKGYRITYEPAAFAVEDPSLSVTDEWGRKVRIGAGAFQAMSVFRPLLDPARASRLGFQYLSRRVLRWVACPLALPAIFILCLLLVIRAEEPAPVYRAMFIGQLVFILLAILGRAFRERAWGRWRFLHLPYYFLWMNLTMWAGFFRYFRGGQPVTWQKASRQAILPNDGRVV